MREPQQNELHWADVLFTYLDVTQDPEASDAMVVLGSYDLRVANHAADLYSRGLAPVVVFTGAHGNWTRGLWPKTEAETFADRAMALSVPKEAILIEPTATNTGENMARSRALLKAEGIEVHRLLVVAKRNIARRAVATLGRIWPGVHPICSGPGQHWTEQISDQRSAHEVIEELVGDIQRIAVYPSLGFQIPQVVPLDVQDAYRELVERGFAGHLVSGYPLQPTFE